MKRFSIFLLALTVFTGCSRHKDFATVEKGMTKEAVITSVGEPAKQNDIGETSIWAYPDADRTVVFREDTVYSIITSAEARIDSIEMSMKKLSDNVEKSFEKLDGTFDSTAERLKESMKKDTLKRKN